MANSRIIELDFMRAFAILMVLVLHVSAAYAAYSPPESRVFYIGLVLNQWSRVCLPLFVFVSGFGIFYGYGSKKLNLKDFYLRRFRAVFLPYLVWSFIYMILRDIFNPSFTFIGLPLKQAFLSYLEWTLEENIHTPIWFVLMIIQLYLIFPFLLKLVKSVKNPLRFTAVNFTIYFFLTIYFRNFMAMSGIPIIDWLQRYYSVNLVGWYFYFILGGIVAKNWKKIRGLDLNKLRLAIAYIITTCFVIIEAYIGFINYGQTHLELYTSIRPTVLINSMAAIPVFYLFAQSLIKYGKITKLLNNISRYSYGIFFVHPQVLTIVKIIVGKIFGTYTTRILQLILVFSLTLVCSYAICRIIDKTRLRGILLGLSNKKPRHSKTFYNSPPSI